MRFAERARRFFVVAAAATLLTACDRDGRRLGRIWERDADRDSRISLQEASADSGLFRQLDTDQDGYVTLTEAAASVRRGRVPSKPDEVAQRFRHFDRDGDSRLDASEYPIGRSLFTGIAMRTGGVIPREAAAVAFAALDSAAGDALLRPGGWAVVADLNGDSSVSAEEMERVSGDAVVMADLDGSGATSYTEAIEADQPPHRWRPLLAATRVLARFASLDRDKDALLSGLELGRDAYLVAQLDSDGDSMLSRNELAVAARLNRLGPTAYEQHVTEVRFRRMDRNGDGRLTSRELGRWRRVERAMDRDRNGVVSLEEFARRADAWRSRLRPARAKGRP